jgi:hypothetical protein
MSIGVFMLEMSEDQAVEEVTSCLIYVMDE